MMDPIAVDDCQGIDQAERLIWAHEILDTLGIEKTDDHVTTLAAQLGMYRTASKRTWATRQRAVNVRLMMSQR